MLCRLTHASLLEGSRVTACHVTCGQALDNSVAEMERETATGGKGACGGCEEGVCEWLRDEGFVCVEWDALDAIDMM